MKEKNRFRKFAFLFAKKSPSYCFELWNIKSRAKMLGSLFAAVDQKKCHSASRWGTVGVCEKKLTFFVVFLSTILQIIESSIINNSLVKNRSKIISKIDPKQLFSFIWIRIRWCYSHWSGVKKNLYFKLTTRDIFRKIQKLMKLRTSLQKFITYSKNMP